MTKLCILLSATRGKWCPFARYGSYSINREYNNEAKLAIHDLNRCLGIDCACWVDDGPMNDERMGHCGLMDNETGGNI